jgi:hypothetical protein
MNARAGAACLFAASAWLWLFGAGARAQTGPAPGLQTAGSVPAGAATNDMLHVTFRNAIEMALRYNLEVIESTESANAARAQRMQALSVLLPQVGDARLHRRVLDPCDWRGHHVPDVVSAGEQRPAYGERGRSPGVREGS